MRQKTKKKPKGFNLNKYIFAALNKIWGWWPPRAAVIRRSTRWVGDIEQTKCEKCLVWFDVLLTKNKKGKTTRKRQTEVDHIEPKVDPEKGPQGFDILIERTFVPEDKLQNLCKKKCHNRKTKKENTRRKR